MQENLMKCISRHFLVLLVCLFWAVLPNALADSPPRPGRDMEDRLCLMVIDAQLTKADAEIAAQNWETANKLLKQALAELGDRYVCPDVIDDTGMKLMAADLQEKEGKLDNAAHVRRRMLADRLEMLRSKTE
jgi:hypothetical protein